VSGFVTRGLARVFGCDADVGEIDQWVVAQREKAQPTRESAAPRCSLSRRSTASETRQFATDGLMRR
jgi:hypothetical protein